MQKFGKITSAAIYGGENYKYYYGYVDFAEKGCAKKCMDQLMSSDEEMNFLSGGQEKNLRTFLRYKWKTTEENPELSGIVTRDYNTMQNGYNPSTTTSTTSMSTPNVMAPPYIPNSYNNHGLSNRRSGNLNLTTNIVGSSKNMNDYGRSQSNNNGMNSVYYSMANQGNAGTINNAANPAMGGMMNMGMNMNMGMGMNMGMDMNSTVGVANANPKMPYNNKYPNWQNNNNNNTRVSTGRGRGRGGLSHRASNRSMHGTRSYQNSNPAYTTMSMESTSTAAPSTAASKGMDATAKEFMPKKDNRLSMDNFYNYGNESDSSSYLKEDSTKNTVGKDTEEDTIVEKQSQDGSVKEDANENADVNDATETASNGNVSEQSTTATVTNHDANPTAEEIMNSIDTETKWGDMKDSSALPPLNIPYTSSTESKETTSKNQGSTSSDDEQEPLPEFVSKPLTRTKLNISRIPPGMTYDQLYSLFLEHGNIVDMTIKPAKIGTVAFLEYTTPAEAMEAVRELDDAYAVDENTPINQIPQNLDSLCVDYAYSDGITRHHRQGVTPIFIKGLPSNMKRGDLKIICVEFGDLAKTRLSKIDSGHGIKCSATIEYVRKDSTRLALAYLGELFHSYGYNTVKVEKYNTNRNSYKPHP